MADDLLVRVDANTTGYEAAILRAERQTKSFEFALRRANEAASQQALALQKQQAALEKTGRTLGVIGAVAAVAFVGAIKSAADFEAKIAQINSLLPETQRAMVPALAAATKGFADLGISATEAADAEIELVKAGVSAKDILGGALQGTLVLSAAGMIDVGQATQIAASAMTQFGLSGAEIPHVADLLAAAADKSLGGVSDLGFGLKQAGTTAAQFGFSIEDTTGLLAEFAAAGLVGEQGGTTLKQMFLQLAAPTAQAQELMDQYNLSLYNSNGTTKNASQLAGMLAEGFKGVTPEVKNAALATIFGSRAIQGANILLADGSKKAGEWAKAVNDQGFAAEQAAGKMDSLNGDLEKLSATFSNFLVDLGSAGQGPARVFVQAITDMLNGITALPDPVKSSILALTGLIAVLGLGSYALIKIKTAMTATRSNMKDLGVGFSGMSKQMMLIRGGAAVAGAALIELGHSGVIASKGLSDTATALGAAALGFSVGGPWGAAVGGGIAILSSMGNEQELTASSVESLTSTIDVQTGALSSNGRAMIAHDIATNGLLKLGQAAGASLEDTTLAAMGNADAYDRVAASLDGGNLVAQEFLKNLRAQMGAVDASKEAAVALAQANEDAGVAGANSGDAIAGMGDQIESAGDAAADAAAKTQKYLDKLLALNDAALGSRGSLRDYEAAIDAATASLKKNGKNLDDNTAKGRENNAALDAIASSAIAHAQAMDKDGDSINKQRQFLESSRAELYNTAQQFGMTKAEAHAYVQEVLKIPSRVATTVALNVAAAMQGILNFGNALKNLHDKTVTIHSNTVNTVLDRHLTGNHAAGGYISGPGSGTSDSIPAMLSNGEFVINAAATRRNLPLLHSINAQKFAGGGQVGGSFTMADLMRLIGKPDHFTTLGEVGTDRKAALAALRDVRRAERDLHRERDRGKEIAKRVQQTEKALEDARGKEKVDKEQVLRIQHRLHQQTMTQNQAARDLTHAEDDLAKKRDVLTKATDKQKEATQALIDQSKAYAETVLSIGAAFGGSGTSVTAQGLLSKLKSSTGSAKDFQHDLKVLSRGHLNKDIMRQLREEGPTEQGLALASSLASHPGLIKRINAQQSAFDRIATSIGTFGTGAGRSHGRHHGGHRHGDRDGKRVEVNINGPIHTHDIHEAARAIRREEEKALLMANLS